MTQKRILELAKIGARANLDDLIIESLKNSDKHYLQEEKRQAFREYAEVRAMLLDEENVSEEDNEK